MYDEISFFDVVHRVKSPKSLYNKLIDKNLIFSFPKENIDLKKRDKEIDDFILETNDLIGIKIITNLYNDCESVFKLLKNELVNHEVGLDFSGKIPDTMKNGLPIYKMNGVFKGFNFELQIKSKLDSAWGDLEHNLFYKDYEFYHLKDNNKKIMSNIGYMLRNAEDLMLTIRNAKTEFYKDYDLINFSKDVNERFASFTKEFIGSTKVIEENIMKLYSIYKYLIIEQEELLSEVDVIENYIDYVSSNEDKLITTYKSIKEKSFQLIVLENIYLNWINKDNVKQQYDELIRGFFKYIIRYNLECASELLNMEILCEEVAEDLVLMIDLGRYQNIKTDLLEHPQTMALFYLINSSTRDIIMSHYDQPTLELSFEVEDVLQEDILTLMDKVIFSIVFDTNPNSLNLIDIILKHDIKVIIEETIKFINVNLKKNKEDVTKQEFHNKIHKKAIELLGGVNYEVLCHKI